MVSKVADGKLQVAEAEFNAKDNSLTFTVDHSGRYTVAYADVPYFDRIGTTFKSSKKINSIFTIVKPGNRAGKVGVARYDKPLNGNKDITIKSKVTFNGVTYRVESVTETAFKNNSAMETVTIGKNVKKLTSEMFKKCSNLKTIKVHSKLVAKVQRIIKKLNLDAEVVDLG